MALELQSVEFAFDENSREYCFTGIDTHLGHYSIARQRATLVEWLNGLLPDLGMPINASDEEVRVFLIDGSILCQILNKLKPGSVTEIRSSQARVENVQRFLSAMDEMGFPRFQAADLENVGV
ncbi:hypothetical protein OROHE_006959 [Orobanche hederae]